MSLCSISSSLLLAVKFVLVLYIGRSVVLSFSPLIRNMYPDSIEMPFGMMVQVGQMNKY